MTDYSIYTELGLNIRAHFYIVIDTLHREEYYLDDDGFPDKWIYNGVQICLNEDGTSWRITTDEVDVYDVEYRTASASGANITFLHGTPEDLKRLAVQMRLTDEV